MLVQSYFYIFLPFLFNTNTDTSLAAVSNDQSVRRVQDDPSLTAYITCINDTSYIRKYRFDATMFNLMKQYRAVKSIWDNVNVDYSFYADGKDSFTNALVNECTILGGYLVYTYRQIGNTCQGVSVRTDAFSYECYAASCWNWLDFNYIYAQLPSYHFDCSIYDAQEASFHTNGVSNGDSDVDSNGVSDVDSNGVFDGDSNGVSDGDSNGDSDSPSPRPWPMIVGGVIAGLLALGAGFHCAIRCCCNDNRCCNGNTILA